MMRQAMRHKRRDQLSEAQENGFVRQGGPAGDAGADSTTPHTADIPESGTGADNMNEAAGPVTAEGFSSDKVTAPGQADPAPDDARATGRTTSTNSQTQSVSDSQA